MRQNKLDRLPVGRSPQSLLLLFLHTTALGMCAYTGIRNKEAEIRHTALSIVSASYAKRPSFYVEKTYAYNHRQRIRRGAAARAACLPYRRHRRLLRRTGRGQKVA